LNHFQNSTAILAVAVQTAYTIDVDKKYRAVHLSVCIRPMVENMKWVSFIFMVVFHVSIMGYTS